jgi:hypothetical protein
MQKRTHSVSHHIIMLKLVVEKGRSTTHPSPLAVNPFLPLPPFLLSQSV